MSNKSAIVLCISGFSVTGKTTLSKFLKKKYGFQIIHLDNYVLEDNNLLPAFNIQNVRGINYELPETIDWDRLISKLENTDPDEKYILDAFIPFASPQIEQFISFLIDIEFNENDFEEGLRRRVLRDTNSEVPTDYEKYPEKSSAHYCAFYFKHFVWPEAFRHPEYRLPPNWNKPLLRLAGSLPLKEICTESDKFVSHILKPFICCISGISTSGKTTVAKYLRKKYGYKIIHLDYYVHDDYSRLPHFNLQNVTGINYELPETIDWDQLVSDLQNMDQSEIVILEGFIPFYSQEIQDCVDCLIDIEFNENEYNEALRRRVERDTGSDVPDDYEIYPDQSSAHNCAFYFKNFVWKEAFSHPEYRLPKNWEKPLLKLSATASIRSNKNESDKFLSSVLKNRK